MRDHPHLYCWMLHEQRLADLIDEPRLLKVLERVRLFASGNELELRTRELDRWLSTHDVPSLEVLLNQGRPVAHKLVWIEAPFQWSRVAHERRQQQASDPTIRSSFTVDLDLDERTVTVHGTFSPRHLTCSSSNSELAGTRTQYVLGSVAEADDTTVELRPLAIADRFFVPPENPGGELTWQHITPRQVDQFSHVDFDAPVTTEDLEALRAVPEVEIKQLLAALIGEPVVPKDWGGEQMDLWTTRLMVDGVQLSAAFLLKGPARFAPMTVAMLGKNGDQLERLASTPADVLVVQHCHSITPAVLGTLRAYARDYGHPRRYMVIDGYDTLRIVHSSRPVR